MHQTRHLFAAAAWPGLVLIYLLLPGHPLALLIGTPLTELVFGLALFVGLAAWCDWKPRGSLAIRASTLLVLALALKLFFAGFALPRGIIATYTSAPDSAQPAERSTEWRIVDATRVDRGLEFVGDRFALHFVNDLRRFNFFTPGQPRRDLLPFSVTWRGWIVESADATRCLRLEANGTAMLRLGDVPPVTVERASHVETRDVCASVQQGTNRLEVRYSRPPDGVPFLKIAETTSDGRSQPLGPERLLRVPASADAAERDIWLGHAARALDLLVIVGLLGFAAAGGRRRAAEDSAWPGSGQACPEPGRRAPTLRGTEGIGRPSAEGAGETPALSGPAWERPLLALSILAAFAEGLVAHRHFAGRTPILSGGNDWLAYESYARDVLLSGPLMTAGKALGQGEPYYYQPLYGYFLAGLHLLLGESVYGPLVAQHVLAAVAGVLTYYLAKELFGRPAAVAAFALFWVYRYLIFNQVAGLLLSENLVAVMIPPMLLLLARWQRLLTPDRWRRMNLVAASALLGLAILTRSTPLLFVPPAALLVMLAQARSSRPASTPVQSPPTGSSTRWRAAITSAGLLVVVAVAVFSLAGLRNLVVAGRLLLLPESASTNIYETHRPSAKVDLSRIERDPLYTRLGFDRRTKEVVEFIRQDPLGYAGTLVPMGLYAIGFTGPALGTNQVQYELVLLTALYLAGLLLVPSVRRPPVWFLHAFVLTHFFQMMVFMSHQYGFRLPLPMYGPMLVVAGATLAALPGVRSEKSRARESALRRFALVAGVLLASLWTCWELVRPRATEAEVFGLGGDAGSSARAVASTPEAWLADRLYFSGQDGRSFGTAYLPGLAYREMLWLDASKALVWPPEGKRGLLLQPPGSPSTLMSECWDSATLQAGPPKTWAGADRLIHWLPAAEQRRCGLVDKRRASFGSFIDLLKVWQVGSSDPGQSELRVLWRVVQAPAFRAQLVAEHIDSNGGVLNTVQTDPYPSGSWEPGELVVARIGIPSGGLPHEASQFAIGFTQGRLPNRLTIDDPLPLFGQIRVMSE